MSPDEPHHSLHPPRVATTSTVYVDSDGILCREAVLAALVVLRCIGSHVKPETLHASAIDVSELRHESPECFDGHDVVCGLRIQHGENGRPADGWRVSAPMGAMVCLVSELGRPMGGNIANDPPDVGFDQTASFTSTSGRWWHYERDPKPTVGSGPEPLWVREADERTLPGTLGRSGVDEWCAAHPPKVAA